MLVELFWQNLGGTMAYRLNITRSSTGSPSVDFTLVTDARFRVVDTAGTETTQTAVILSDPAATATTISIRHVLAPGDFTVAGNYLINGEVSIDGGASWYATDPAQLTVRNTLPS